MGLYNINHLNEGILSEAYIPKSKYLKRAEELLDKIRSPYLVDDAKGIVGTAKINLSRFSSTADGIVNSKEWLEFERCFEKQFGFKTFTVNLMRSAIPNAMTLPVSFDITHIKGFDDVLDKSGLRYKESAGISAISFISDGMLFNGKFTSGQILAVMLHEVGHNFSQMGIEILANINCGKVLINVAASFLALFNKIQHASEKGGVAQAAVQALGSVLGVIFTTDWAKENFNTSKRNNAPMSQALDILFSVFGTNADIALITSQIMQIKDTLITVFTNKIISSLKYNIKNQVGNLTDNYKQAALNQLVNYPGFMDESFADKFVAMNGYGVEFSTAIKLMDSEAILGFGMQGDFDKVPVLGQFMAVNYIVNKVFNQILSGEPHPTTASRIKTQISILRAEMKEPGISKKTKSMIERDIANIEIENERLEKQLKSDINFRSSHYRIYIMSFDKFVTKLQPKKDVREALLGVIKSDSKIIETLKKNANSMADKISNKLKLR